MAGALLDVLDMGECFWSDHDEPDMSASGGSLCKRQIFRFAWPHRNECQPRVRLITRKRLTAPAACRGAIGDLGLPQGEIVLLEWISDEVKLHPDFLQPCPDYLA